MLEYVDLNPRPDHRSRGGTAVHRLVAGEHGCMAQLILVGGTASHAVYHRTVEELWFVLEGVGHIWRAEGDGPGQVDDLKPGRSINIPAGTRFQFKANGPGPLKVLGVTMPPSPEGGPEAVPSSTSRW